MHVRRKTAFVDKVRYEYYIVTLHYSSLFSYLDRGDSAVGMREMSMTPTPFAIEVGLPPRASSAPRAKLLRMPGMGRSVVHRRDSSTIVR